MNKTCYICENNIDGIFTGVYDAWSSRKGHNMVKLQVSSGSGTENYELFTDYVNVDINSEKAVKVARAIKSRICDRAYEMVVRASLTEAPDKADMIYRFLVIGFAMGAKVVNHMADPVVARIFELNRFVMNDAHFYKGFLRFEELDGGIMLAKYEPQNNITALMAEHFSDRFPEENFVIYDVKRRVAALHQARHAWVLVTLSEEAVSDFEKSSNAEEEYRKLWFTFFNTIGIKERENKGLQRQMLRMHYRKYMTEFQIK